jgi:hypothetical protein
MALQIAIIKQAAWSSTVRGGKPRGLRLVYQAKGSILASMGQTATLLSPVQEGRIWRVRILWANGAIHHFGKFTSEKDAVGWIAAHSQLTKPLTEVEPSLPRNRVRSRKARSPNLLSS